MIVGWGNGCRIVCGTILLLPDNICHKIALPKHLVTNLSQLCDLAVIYTDKNHAVVAKQIPRQHKTRINHTAPVGVEASVCFGILEQAVAVLSVHAHFFVVFLADLCEFVTVNKVVACVLSISAFLQLLLTAKDA